MTRSLRRARLAALTAGLGLSLVAAPVAAFNPATAADTVVAQVAWYRASSGVPALARDPALDATAMTAARCMAAALPDVSCQPPGVLVGFNSGFTDEESSVKIVEGWMKNAGHRAVILDPSWTRVGAAAFEDGDRRYYGVAFSSVPLPTPAPTPSPSPQPAPTAGPTPIATVQATPQPAPGATSRPVSARTPEPVRIATPSATAPDATAVPGTASPSPSATPRPSVQTAAPAPLAASTGTGSPVEWVLALGTIAGVLAVVGGGALVSRVRRRS